MTQTSLPPAASVHQRESLRFGGLVIEYDERVLRPRPWTQLQSTMAADAALEGPDGPILELCTGAGHIGLLAAHLARRPLVAVDVSETACRFAQLNAEGAGISERVEVRNAPMQEALADDERFAVVVADPPWVRSTETGRFPEDPLLAIDGGDDGLDLARACVEVARRHLVPGGSLLLQLGDDAQGDALLAEHRDDWREADRQHGTGGVIVRWTPAA